jgi:protein-L-isoaspartate(D-aspartate) O-methyltransferase
LVTAADYSAERDAMVADQIRARGVCDPRVLDALRRVPRHLFIPEAAAWDAYGDYPVPIGFGQTISQPYIVGFMTEALQLEPAHRVLEIGAGCGYQSAVLAELAAQVYSIEIVPELAARAQRIIEAHGYRNVEIRAGDGHEGWSEAAPFDRILGAAAADRVPPALIEQLADGGILVIPVGGTLAQELLVQQKSGDSLKTLTTLPVRFVPMVKGRGR